MSDTSVASSVVSEVHALLQRLGVPASAYQGATWLCARPLTGEVVAHVPQHTPAQASDAIGRAHAAFATWRTCLHRAGAN